MPSAEKALGFPIMNNYFLNPIVDDNGIIDLDIKKLWWLKQPNIGEHTKKYIDDFQQLLAGELKREFSKADKEIAVPQNYRELEKIGTTKTGWQNPLFIYRCIANVMV